MFLQLHIRYELMSARQVAFSRTSPGGRVVGVDVIPAQPPAGVSTIQGDFLSPSVQAEVRAYVKDPQRGRPWHRPTNLVSHLHALSAHQQNTERVLTADTASDEAQPVSSTTSSNVPSDLSIAQAHTPPQSSPSFLRVNEDSGRGVQSDEVEERVVDVVLSDMSAPWVQPSTTWKRSFSDPYYRMMNASGLKSKDHIDSMVSLVSRLMEDSPTNHR